MNITIVMSTPYLDEAERCSRVALMNGGKLMVADTPQNLKGLMNGEVIEIVCQRVRDAANILKANPQIRDVQTFGDRLNIIVEDSRLIFPIIKQSLKESNIEVDEWRVISPSLENIFISLMSNRSQGEPQEQEDVHLR